MGMSINKGSFTMTRVSPAAATPAATDRPDRPTEDAPASEGDKKQGRPKQNKTDFRTEGMDKFKAWPAEYDARKHKPLAVEDFEAEDVFWNQKAGMYDKRAAECRNKAELFTKFGSAEKRKSAEKIGKLATQLELLKATMTASGDLTEAEVMELINQATASIAAPAETA